MDINPEEYKLIDRINNFYIPQETRTDDIPYWASLQSKFNDMEAYLKNNENPDNNQLLLKKIFSFVFNFNIYYFDIMLSKIEGYITFYDLLYDVCFFNTLAMFIHNTKNIKGSTLTKFTYNHSNAGYKEKGSPNYINWDSPQTQISKKDTLTKETETLRKHRNRHLSKQPAHIDANDEWSAMRADSEHEWSLYFKTFPSNIQDTLKRLGNLYNDVNTACASPLDDGYEERLHMAYKKFASKLKKIKYENYLELCKYFLDHIDENKQYYGINIYRFEKELMFHINIGTINQLCDCDDPDKKNIIKLKHSIMRDIDYPVLYAIFGDLPIDKICIYTNLFKLLRYYTTLSGLSILDKFVEDGIFGQDWETLFNDILNEMTEKLFSFPPVVDFVSTEEKQENYYLLLEFLTQRTIDAHILNYRTNRETNKPKKDD